MSQTRTGFCSGAVSADEIGIRSLRECGSFAAGIAASSAMNAVAAADQQVSGSV